MPTGDALLRAFVQSGAKLAPGQISGELVGGAVRHGLSQIATIPAVRRQARRVESLIGQADAQAKLAEAQADDLKFKQDFAAAKGAQQVLSIFGTILDKTPEQAAMFLPQANKALLQYGYPTFDEKDLPKSREVSVVAMPHIGRLYSTSATTEAAALKTIQSGAAAMQQSLEFQGLPPQQQVEALKLFEAHANKYATMADRLLTEGGKAVSKDQIIANYMAQLKAEAKDAGTPMTLQEEIQTWAKLQSPGLLSIFGLANDSAKALGAGGVTLGGKAGEGGISLRLKKYSVGTRGENFDFETVQPTSEGAKDLPAKINLIDRTQVHLEPLVLADPEILEEVFKEGPNRESLTLGGIRATIFERTSKFGVVQRTLSPKVFRFLTEHIAYMSEIKRLDPESRLTDPDFERIRGRLPLFAAGSINYMTGMQLFFEEAIRSLRAAYILPNDEFIQALDPGVKSRVKAYLLQAKQAMDEIDEALERADATIALQKAAPPTVQEETISPEEALRRIKEGR